MHDVKICGTCALLPLLTLTFEWFASWDKIGMQLKNVANEIQMGIHLIPWFEQWYRKINGFILHTTFSCCNRWSEDEKSAHQMWIIYAHQSCSFFSCILSPSATKKLNSLNFPAIYINEQAACKKCRKHYAKWSFLIAKWSIQICFVIERKMDRWTVMEYEARETTHSEQNGRERKL